MGSNARSNGDSPISKQWIVCPKCHGNGKIRKAPSRKARLRQKRARLQQNKTGTGTGTSKRGISLSNALPQQSTPPLQPRMDPCPSCQQTGLVRLPVMDSSKRNNTTEPGDSRLPHVAIIGGGLGGLALGIACLHRRIPFHIFERDDHFFQRSQGYGLTLQQASRALASFGISQDELLKEDLERGRPPVGITSTKHVVHTIDGTVVGEWGLRKWGRKRQSPDQVSKTPEIEGKESEPPPPQRSKARKRQNVHIARQALRRELLMALGDEKQQASVISWGHRLVRVVSSSHSSRSEDGQDQHPLSDCPIVLEFEAPSTSSKTDEGGGDKMDATAPTNEKKTRRVAYSKPNMLVVGADGIRSNVRDSLLSLKMAKDNSSQLRYLECVVILGICPLRKLKKETSEECALLDGETVFQTADGETRIYLMPFSTTEYMWQLSFPMQEEDKAKNLSFRGPKALKDEALARCGQWHRPIPEVLEQTPLDLVSGYPVYDRDLITVDTLESTLPITLVGDAAHPMSPFKGQGANQALLDALSLAQSLYMTCCIGDSGTEPESIARALKSYHNEMTERSASKVRASAEAAKFLHTEAAILEGNVTRGAAAAAAAISTVQRAE